VLRFETSRQCSWPGDWSTMTSQTSAMKLLGFVAYDRLLLTGLTRSFAVLRLRVAVH